MHVVTCDSKGRLYLRDKLREEYGSKFVAVPGPREIILMPVTEDAVADLRQATRQLQGKSMKTLKRAIEEELRGQMSK